MVVRLDASIQTPPDLHGMRAEIAARWREMIDAAVVDQRVDMEELADAIRHMGLVEMYITEALQNVD